MGVFCADDIGSWIQHDPDIPWVADTSWVIVGHWPLSESCMRLELSVVLLFINSLLLNGDGHFEHML